MLSLGKCSLAILGDDRKDWHPQSYGFAVGECRLLFEFPVVKLLNYRNHEKQLERSPNLFAMVVRVHLKGLETRRSVKKRLYWKQELFKIIHQASYRRQEILDLFWFMDWVLALPPTLEQQFNQFVKQYEEEKKVRYVTSLERMGIEKGLQQGELRKSREHVVEVLQMRFKRVPKTLVNKIQAIEDPTRLSKLHKEAVVVKSLNNFKQLLEVVVD